MAADGFANKNDLIEALQGVERQTLELIAEVSTSDEWAMLLAVPLRRAIARGNRDLAQKLVDGGAAFEYAMHEAAAGGHGGIVNDLLENYAEIETTDEHGRTPLHVAAMKGQTEMVQLLLLKGADKDALTADNRSFPALFLAIESNNVATARALLAGGADVNAPHAVLSRTALHMAAQTGHVEMLRAMLEHGADLHAAGSLGYTALHLAASDKSSEVVDMLVEAGASIDARDKYDATPLFFAAEELKPVAVIALLRHGADVNARGDNNDTPLHCAVLRSDTIQRAAEVVDLLLRSGADANAQDDEDGDTPLHTVARKAGVQGAAGLVDLLLRSGADETIRNKHDQDAMDVVGPEVEEEDRVIKDVNRVRKLLMDAPADRSWRRRGYLVLCRAHPDRVQLLHKSSGQHDGTARRPRGRTKLARAEQNEGCGETVGGNLMDAKTDGDWPDVVRTTLGLQEEDIFRTIVGYL
eukprot:g12594.t1